MQDVPSTAAALWPLYEPYSRCSARLTAADLRRDVVAGLTVSIVALPLSRALAIASGTTPDEGLHAVALCRLRRTPR